MYNPPLPEKPPEFNIEFSNKTFSELENFSENDNLISSSSKSFVRGYFSAIQMFVSFLTPILFFSIGGNFLIKRFSMPSFLMPVFILGGVILAFLGAVSSAKRLIKDSTKNIENPKIQKKLNSISRKSDNDYYYEYDNNIKSKKSLHL